MYPEVTGYFVFFVQTKSYCHWSNYQYPYLLHINQNKFSRCWGIPSARTGIWHVLL